jgi:hypothetical protein
MRERDIAPAVTAHGDTCIASLVDKDQLPECATKTVDCAALVHLEEVLQNIGAGVRIVERVVSRACAAPPSRQPGPRRLPPSTSRDRSAALPLRARSAARATRATTSSV